MNNSIENGSPINVLVFLARSVEVVHVFFLVLIHEAMSKNNNLTLKLAGFILGRNSLFHDLADFPYFNFFDLSIVYSCVDNYLNSFKHIFLFYYRNLLTTFKFLQNSASDNIAFPVRVLLPVLFSAVFYYNGQ